MMTKSPPTLRRVFNDPDPRLKDKSSAEGRAWTESTGRELPGVEWVASKYDLVAKIGELLDVPVPDLLIQFWEKSDEIAAALRDSKESPDKSTDLGLFEHTLEGMSDPSIEVRIGKMPKLRTFPITFTLELECKLVGAVLRIKNGAIEQILAGSCAVKGTLKHGKLLLATAPRDGQGKITFGGKEIE